MLVFLYFPMFFLLPGQLAAQSLQHRPRDKPADPSPGAVPANSQPAPPLQKPVLAIGTNFQVQISHPYPMKAGESVEGRIVYPIFYDGEMVIPQNTLVRGTVVGLIPDKKERWHGRLRADFTPFHTAQVQFTQLMLPGGAIAVSTSAAITGTPALHLAAASATPSKAIFARYWSQAKSNLHDRLAVFTSPGLGDRALQMLYNQLPYHPERIQAGTLWSFEVSVPLTLPETLPTPPVFAPPAPVQAGKPDVWIVNALLTCDLSSQTAKAGDPVRALVIEPVYDKGHQLVVAQDSILIGKVTAAKPARALGRNGKLRFTFQEVRFPKAEGVSTPDRSVEGALAGATAESAQGLSLDAEGTITPRNKASAVVPLLLTMLAGRALDDDGNITAQTGVASNGFGLIGRVVGLAAGSRSLAAGIGFYAAGLSFYENFLHKGTDVAFPKDTRIEIETSPVRAPVLTPERP